MLLGFRDRLWHGLLFGSVTRTVNKGMPQPGCGAGGASMLRFWQGTVAAIALIAGALLVALVRRGEPVAEPLVEAVNRRLRTLERIAAGA